MWGPRDMSDSCLCVARTCIFNENASAACVGWTRGDGAGRRVQGLAPDCSSGIFPSLFFGHAWFLKFITYSPPWIWESGKRGAEDVFN